MAKDGIRRNPDPNVRRTVYSLPSDSAWRLSYRHEARMPCRLHLSPEACQISPQGIFEILEEMRARGPFDDEHDGQDLWGPLLRHCWAGARLSAPPGLAIHSFASCIPNVPCNMTPWRRRSYSLRCSQIQVTCEVPANEIRHDNITRRHARVGDSSRQY